MHAHRSLADHTSVSAPPRRTRTPAAPGSETRLHLPNFDLLTVDQNHTLAIEFFAAANYFGAHEAWETCWAMSKGTEEEVFFKGFAQLGAGYTHWARGNAHGVDALLGRALDRIGARGSPHRDVDINALRELLETDRAVAVRVGSEGRALPELGARTIPRQYSRT